MKGICISLLALLILISGCSSSTSNVGSLVLPTSNRTIDVVQHRSDSRGCAELVVLQTYTAVGELIDSKEGRATALPCALVGVVVEAGAHVGSAAIIANGVTKAAKAAASASNSLTITNTNGQTQTSTSTYSGGEGGSSSGGNNGQGNGSGDGTNNGTDHHHNNGDNN